MRVAHAVVLLLLLTAGCARAKPDTTGPEPKAVATQVDDLLDRFREYYKGRAKLTMKDLRRSYDLLMMKVLSLLQDADEKLASAIVSSREAIWGVLADPKKFATLLG